MTTHLPRSEWATHRNYPEHVLLLGSHSNFRRVSSHLVSETLQRFSQSPKTPAATQFLQLFKRWKAAMKSHEGYEEHKLYPYLQRKFGVSMAILELHHRQLGLAEDRVLKAYEEGDALQFAHALKKHDDILVPHLAQEEEIVIPLLLSLSREEFRSFTSS